MNMTSKKDLTPSILLAALLALPFAAQAQLPSLKNLPGLGALGSSKSDSGNVTGQNDALVRGYVAANKDVLLANALMAESLGLKDQAATARATAEALTDGATKGNLEDSNKAVSASTEAVAAEIAKSPKLDAQSKATYQSGLAKLAQGLLKYVNLRQPAQSFATGLKEASPMVLPKLQSGAYIASSANVSVETKAGGFRSFFAGEGIFVLKVASKEPGTVLAGAFGGIEEIQCDGSLVIDTGHLVAWDAGLEYSVGKSADGWIASWLSGEGLVCHFRGQGRIWIQSRNPGEYGSAVGALLPARTN